MRQEFFWKNSYRSHRAEAYARKRADAALDRFANQIDVMRLKFEDINGPKGGLDKLCTIQVTGRLSPHFTSATAADYESAADQAFGKLKRALARTADAHKG